MNTSILQLQLRNQIRELEYAIADFPTTISPDGNLDDVKLLMNTISDITKRFIGVFKTINRLPDNKGMKKVIHHKHIQFMRMSKTVTQHYMKELGK